MKFKTLQELFSDPTRWTKYASARTDRGYSTSINSPNAVCWCLGGGIALVYPDQEASIDDKLRVRLVVNGLGVKISTFNDDPKTTIEDIQKLVKEANI